MKERHVDAMIGAMWISTSVFADGLIGLGFAFMGAALLFRSTLAYIRENCP